MAPSQSPVQRRAETLKEQGSERFQRSRPLVSHFPGDREHHQGHRLAIEDVHTKVAKSGRESNTSYGVRPWDTAARDAVPKAKEKGNGIEDEETRRARSERARPRSSSTTCSSSWRRRSTGRENLGMGSSRRRFDPRGRSPLLRHALPLYRPGSRRYQRPSRSPNVRKTPWHRSRTPADMGDRDYSSCEGASVPRRVRSTTTCAS